MIKNCTQRIVIGSLLTLGTLLAIYLIIAIPQGWICQYTLGSPRDFMMGVAYADIIILSIAGIVSTISFFTKGNIWISITKIIIINICIWLLIGSVPLVRFLSIVPICGTIGIMLNVLCLWGLCYVWTLIHDCKNTPKPSGNLSHTDSPHITNVEFSADIVEILELPEIKHLQNKCGKIQIINETNYTSVSIGIIVAFIITSYSKIIAFSKLGDMYYWEVNEKNRDFDAYLSHSLGYVYRRHLHNEVISRYCRWGTWDTYRISDGNYFFVQLEHADFIPNKYRWEPYPLTEILPFVLKGILLKVNRLDQIKNPSYFINNGEIEN